ncbi:EAL domain-containing protein [Methylobacterium sp. WL64]|uniref:putative bifunctional diguanylate cyclase/phosphodiesterase n=1 Tax=Methylobacterium sp. WL64 TaxID=2603894 RepID=UPI0011CB012A|nr:EAL domain-containing protein [Methylobacterium sp. WL64]TXM97887.1 EAL domain-containing protein [Methylobacterium sp. WL64]
MSAATTSDCVLAEQETLRLHALGTFQIAGTAPEERFDAIAQLAARLFRAPIAYVSLIDQHHQWIKAQVGLDQVGLDQVGLDPAPTARGASFCTHTIRSDDLLVIPDTRRDPRFSDNPLAVRPPFVRFYAGAPLITADGFRLGALCVADTVPRRHFPARDRRALADLAALVVQQMTLRRSELARVSMMGFANATELALLAISREGRIRFANQAAAALFGYTHDEMLGEPFDLIVPERMRAAHTAGLKRIFAGDAAKVAGRTIEVMVRRKDGAECPAEIALSVWHDEGGPNLGAIIRDISERRRREAGLLRLAHQDALTGLTNRRRFETLLNDLYRRGQPAAVLLVDLDGFKAINDSLGHAVGDALLQALAVRIPAVLPRRAVMARLGGDEFVVLLPGTGDPLAARACATAVLAALADPVVVETHVLRAGASIGFALAPEHGRDGEELLASADFALYRAKQEGGGSARMFASEMRHAATALRNTQDALLRALHGDELVLHYQPQICLTSGRLVGAEALLRWQHPERGLLLPGTFLPAIKMSPLALPVGAWVLDAACRQIAAWRDQGLPPFRVGANLFSAQFKTGNLVREVSDALARHRVPPEALELEITERVVLQNDDRTLGTIRDLRALGVRIAFDDFGTGYASLSSLKRFPLTTLKIDRTFVSDLLTEANDAAITRAIIRMSNDLGLDTVAEGIETEGQEVVLRALGCKVGQGFHYGRAMPAAALTRLMAERPETGAWLTTVPVLRAAG